MTGSSREEMEIETQLRRWMALAIFILIAISSTAVLANSQSDKRIIQATWMDHPPVIDGDLLEGAWQKAKVVTLPYSVNFLNFSVLVLS